MTVVPPKPRFERQDPPEIAALRRLRAEHAELAVAIDLQIDIVTLQRRTQARISTPWVAIDAERVATCLGAGRPLLRVDDVSFDWLELRLLFRQMADTLFRYEMIETADHAALMALARDSRPSVDDVRGWFDARAARGLGDWAAAHGDTLGQVLDLCSRPFVERAGETMRARLDLSAWQHPYCPVCGGDAEMASLSATGDRRLHCGGCGTNWAFDADTCPACDARGARQFVSYASQDGRYRVVACRQCQRYLKAADARYLERPVMLSVDTIATLPLDAAAQQRGYLP